MPESEMNITEQTVSTTKVSRVPYISPEPGEKERAFVMMNSGSSESFEAYTGIDKAAAELGYDLVMDVYFDLNDGTIQNNIQKAAGLGQGYILFPGFEFKDTVLQMHSVYPEVEFVLLDSVIELGENVTTFWFNEYDIGFLAGYTASLELKEADFGFIGGRAEESSSSYFEGFRDGLEMADVKTGNESTFSEENIVYNDSFFDKDNAALLASQLYDRGVDAIFIAAGEAGMGAVVAAKQRTFSGEESWIIGSDEDWFKAGIYNGSDSVVLTSSVKRFDAAAYLMSVLFHEGELKEISNLEGNIANGSVGLPDENVNLSPDTLILLEDLMN